VWGGKREGMNDQMFLAFIKQHSDFGYGRMMQIISYAWYEWLKREHPGMEEGAFVGTCISDLSERHREAYFTILQKYKEEGMDF
jgi:hypothetical protein